MGERSRGTGPVILREAGPAARYGYGWWRCEDRSERGRRRVAQVLGVEGVIAALHAIEAGDASEEQFAVVGDDWDVEERTAAELERTSRGRPQLLLLDEPTNNLDLDSVAQRESALTAYRGALLVASHDERFLDAIGIHRWLRLTDGRLVETAAP